MARPLKLEWTPEALADLKRFEAFLRETYPKSSKAVAHALLTRAELLLDYPNLGIEIKERPPDRQIVARILKAAYVLHYRADERRVLILRVFHSRESGPPV